MTKPITWFSTWLPLVKLAQAVCLAVVALMFADGREQWFVYSWVFIFACLGAFLTLFTIASRYFEWNGSGRVSFNVVEFSLNALFAFCSFALSCALLWDIWMMRKHRTTTHHTRIPPHFIGQDAWVRRCIIVALSYCIEIVNKLVIPLALVQISRASYESVRMTSYKRPSITFKDQQTMCPKTTYLVTVCASIVVVTLMILVINFSTLTMIPVRENHQSLMCNFSPPEPHGVLFNVFAFTFGYLLTSVAYVYFYLRVPILLKKRYSTISSTAGSSRLNWVSIMRIRRTVTAFVIVYLLCWTPYWILFWFPSFMLIQKSWMVIVYKFTHLLPYISCTAYPVILTAINKGIRSAHSNIMSSQRKKFNTIREGAYQMITAQIGFVQTWLREDGARPSIIRPRWSSIGVSRDNSLEQTVVI